MVHIWLVVDMHVQCSFEIVSTHQKSQENGKVHIFIDKQRTTNIERSQRQYDIYTIDVFKKWKKNVKFTKPDINFYCSL